MRKGWTETTLSEIAEVNMGQSPPGSSYNSDGIGLPFMQGSAEFGEHNPTPVKWCSLPAKIAEVGDLLLSVRAPVGDTNIANQRIAIGRGLATIRGGKESITEFLRLLVQKNTAELIANSGTGMFSSITGKNLKEFKVLMPPLGEQKRIVDVVSSVDAYIDALQQQLNCALRAKSALLEKELLKNFGGARKVTLGEVLEISRGGSPRPIQNYLTTEENGINWIKIGDASSSTKYIYETQQKIKPEGLSKTKKVYPGDFLLSNSMSFGRPYIMRTEGCIHDGWLLLGDVSKHFDEDFLYNFLRSGFIQAQFASLAAGSGVRNLNIEVVSGVEIVLPLVSDQKKIAQFLNSFDEQELALELALEKAVVLRGAILTDLLSGNHEIPASYDSLLGAA
jgi:type I restriction enzyme S subunit